MTVRALQLLDAMQQEGLQPDVITGSALISACEEGTMADRSLQLFEPCSSWMRCSSRDSSPMGYLQRSYQSMLKG